MSGAQRHERCNHTNYHLLYLTCQILYFVQQLHIKDRFHVYRKISKAVLYALVDNSFISLVDNNFIALVNMLLSVYTVLIPIPLLSLSIEHFKCSNKNFAITWIWNPISHAYCLTEQPLYQLDYRVIHSLYTKLLYQNSIMQCLVWLNNEHSFSNINCYIKLALGIIEFSVKSVFDKKIKF